MRGVGRRDGDHQRAEAHQQHREHQRPAPAVVIAEVAEQPAADRPDDEAEREEDRGVQLLDDRILAGKEGARRNRARTRRRRRSRTTRPGCRWTRRRSPGPVGVRRRA